MAENKKSFVAYSDWYGIFKALPDEVAGKLIKHIFSYVNDENPTTDDYIINALFEPIKNALKRDLIKWENERQQRSDAGKKSAELRSQRNSTSVETRSTKSNETERNSTDNVNVNVNDNVINNKIEERKLKFADTLKPFVQTYGKEMIRKFFDYWTEPNKSQTKFKMELEKTWSLERRLQTWADREKDFKKETPQTKIITYPEL